MKGAAPDAGAFLDAAERLAGLDACLSPLQAGLLAASHLGIAGDSRSFSRLLGIEHALVLRELAGLAEDGDLLRITGRDPRTMRTHYVPGAEGARLLAALDPPVPLSLAG
ncbi:hypothetical protein [Aquamicrobium terrae]|uniref:Formate dehydrogenase F4B subunit n=1 Tax=Aquamicrobium terrae TaxID=1324945 RepID=A0ABV2N0H9_9HYPH